MSNRVKNWVERDGLRAILKTHELVEARWAAGCRARTLPCVGLRQDFLLTRACDAPPAALDAEPAGAPPA